MSVRAKFDRPKVFRLPPPPGPKPVDARFDGGITALFSVLYFFVVNLIRWVFSIIEVWTMPSLS